MGQKINVPCCQLLIGNLFLDASASLNSFDPEAVANCYNVVVFPQVLAECYKVWLKLVIKGILYILPAIQFDQCSRSCKTNLVCLVCNQSSSVLG